MKKQISILALLGAIATLASCTVSGNSSSSSGAKSSYESSGGSADTSQGSGSGSSSSSESGTTASSTTILPDQIASYTENGYSFNYYESYKTFMDDKDLSLLDDSSLGGEYTTLDGTSTSITITEAGTYYLKDLTISDITLNLTVAGNVHLYFENVTMSGAKKAIQTKGSDLTETLILTLASGSSNSITTAKSSFDLECGLVINGSGSLTISSSEKHGIKTTSDVAIKDATLTISTLTQEEGHAITAESIYAKNAKISVPTAGKDGLNAEIEEAELTKYVNSAGYVYLVDSEFSYSGYGDGIQADSFVYSSGSELTITNTPVFVAYGSSEATTYGITDSDDFKFKKSGSTYYKVASENRGVSGTYALANSVKGVKVGEIDQTISEVETDINSIYYAAELIDTTIDYDGADDGVHVNQGYCLVTDSDFEMSSLDQALQSDGPLTITDSKINITSSYEGIEGSSIHINGSKTDIDIVSSDDGMNAASDYLSSNISYYRLTMNFNGGNVNVHAGGDGLDSNGSIYFNGGNIVVEGSSNGGDSPLDSAESNENSQDHGYYCNGASLIATGSNGMLESPQTSSSQYSFVYGYSSGFKSGDAVAVKDSSGNTVLTSTLTKTAQALIASDPSFSLNSVYSIYVNNSSVGSITLTSKVTTNVTSGWQTGGGPGGQGGPGGR